MASNRNLLVLPGDGIGPEVVAQALRAVEPLGIALDIQHFPWQEYFCSKTRSDWKHGQDFQEASDHRHDRREYSFQLHEQRSRLSKAST